MNSGLPSVELSRGLSTGVLHLPDFYSSFYRVRPLDTGGHHGFGGRKGGRESFSRSAPGPRPRPLAPGPRIV